MRRTLAALLFAVPLALCGQNAFAQTIATINSAAPASVISGSGDTAITLTLRQSGTTRYNVCFYNGTTSATIVPTAYNFTTPSAVTYTFTVPGAQFQTGTSARTNSVYLIAGGASVANGCTGTNAGISQIFSYSTTASSYALRTASPSTLASGSDTTTITLTGAFPTFPTNGSGLGLCFYSGTNNTPILPTSQTSTSSVAFAVPAATFANPATAKIYLATASSTCTGSNTAYSNTLSYTISQGMRFNIQSTFPESVAAGGGNVAVSLYGSLQGTGIPNNGVCFYTGPNTTPTAIAPTSFTTSEIDFVIPASALQIPTSSFSSGTYNAQVQLGVAGGSCTPTAQGISNVYSLPIGYPTVRSASASVLPQVNLNSNYTYLPTNLEIFGDNFGSKFSGRFIPAGGTQFETTGFQVDQYDATVQLLRPSSNTATTAVYGCNYSQGNVYEYCSTTPLSITNYALATSTTQIASSPAAPSPGSPVTLSATVTPGAGSTTTGGTFVPGPATGTVTFSDNGTSLGTATLAGGALRLAPTGTQDINIYAGTDALPVTGESRRSRAAAAAIRNPNETPNPDINSQFTSLMADFNKDGINDTLIIQSTTGILHLFLGGSPLGTIQSEQTIYPSNNYCSSLSGVTVADFNGDGFPDIAFLCGDSGGYSNLQVLLNQGDGSFPYGPSNLGYVSGNQLAAGDVNKDGKIDLVVTGNTGSFCCTGQTFGIQVYTGDGAGNFTSGTLTTTADIPGTQVVLKDLNNDGAADLVFLHYDATAQKTEVALWQNNGSGGFTKLTALPVCNCQVTNSKLFVTPLTTSSLYPDIVVDYSEGSNILAFVNKKTATIGFTTVAPALNSNLTDVVLGDFNGDGFTDFAQYNGTNITIELGNGTGTFALNNAAFAPYTVGTGSTNLVSLATAPDLNGDGYADLIAIFPTATSNSSTIASYVTTGTSIASLPTTLNTGGSRTITTVYTGNRNVLGSNGSQAITVGRTAPTINWTPATTANTTTPLGSTILNATATSGGVAVPGSFAYTPAAGSFLAAGTQTITAVFTPTDTNTYSAATTTRNVTVSKTTPTITTTINPGNHTYTPNLATTYSAFVNGTFIVPTGNVQANNNGSPVGSLAGLSQSGTNQSSTAIVFGSLPAGTFAFTATYQGDAVYNAVTSSVTNYTVSQSTPTITYTPAPTSIPYGTGLVAAQLNATAVDPNTGASIPGTFTYSTPGFTSLQTGSVLPAGSNVITASFAPTDSQDYAAVSKTATITVAVASTTTAVAVSPNTITPGQSVLLSVTVTPNPSGSAVTGVVMFSDDNGTIPNAQVTLSNGTATRNYTPANTGTHHISAAYAGTVNYSPSSSATPAAFTVGQATPRITYTPTPATIVYGTGLIASQLNATAVDSNGTAIPGVFTYATPSIPVVQTGTVLPAGTNVVTAKFTPTDTTTYSTVGQGATITVTPFTPNIVWATPAPISYGTALSATQLNAVANDINGTAVPGAFSYSPGAGTIQNAGNLPVTVNFTPTDRTNFVSSQATRTITITPGITTTSINLNPATIVLGQTTYIAISVVPTIGPNTVFGMATITDDRGTVTLSPVNVNNGLATSNYTPTTTGIHTIKVSYAGYSGAGNYAPSSATAPLTVTQGTPVVTFSPNPATITYGTPLSAAQLNATTTVPGVFAYSPALNTILDAGVNTITATFTPTDTDTYTTVTKTATVTVTKFTPIITWATPASIPYGTPLSSAQLNAVANDVNGIAVPGTYVYNPAAGTIPTIGNTPTTVNFTPTNTTNFATASALRTITVTAGTTTTSINLNPATLVLGQSTTIGISVIPTLGSNMVFGQVTVTDDRGIITPAQVSLAYGIASVTYTPTTVGVHTINVSYPGNGNYAASSASAPLTVTQGTPVITFAPNPATIPYGTPLSAAQLNAAQTGSIPGAFSYSSPLGTVLSVGANTITATFTPTDTTSYSTVTKTVTVTITQFTPVITWAASTISFGTALSATQLNAVANDINGTAIPGTYSYSPAAGTILPVGANPVTVTFTPTNTTNFATATATRTITVIRTATVTTLSINPTTIGVGQPSTITATVTPTSGAGPVTGQVSFTDSLGTITPAQVTLVNGVATFSYSPTAVGTHVITVSFPNTTNNSASSAGGNLIVGKGVPVINFTPNPATIPYGTPLSAAQLNAVETTGTILGSFSYSSPLGTVLNATANTITATFTPADTANYSTVTKTAVVTVTQFTPVIVWPTPASIPFGTPLSSTQLNAVANDINGVAVPGTYSYSPAAGTVLPVGITVDTLTFTPSNSQNFAVATAGRSLSVASAPTTTTVNINPGTITLGQPATLTATVAPTVGTTTVTGSVTFTDNRGTIPSGIVTLSNGVATLSYTPTANGTHAITATYSGSANYAGSTGVGTLAVGQGLPVITFAPNPSTIVYGTPLSAAQLDAVQTTTIPGAFSYSSPLGTILPVGANVITATFTPTDTVNYATVIKTATVTVTQATPVITWTPAANTTTTTPVDATLLNATANVPGAFAYTPSLGSFLPAGRQTLSTTFTPTDTLNYASVTTTAATTVAKTATTAILTANPSSLSSPGTPTALSVLLSGVNITPTGNIQFFDGTTFLGASGLTGPSAHNAVASINTTLAAGPHTLFATYNGDPVYLPATSNSLSYLVGGATPPITFAPNPATIPYGTPLSAAQLNATSTVPGVFSYFPALNTILDAGVNTITATFTPTDTATYATTVKTATVTVTQFTPVIVWATPAAITYGTALSATQLNAVANDINGTAIPGTYAYAPPAGTVLPVGTTQEALTFTPANTTNFATATATRAITVNAAPTTNVLTLSANPITVGQSVTLTSTLTSLAGTPTGTVTFFQNGGSSALVIGTVSLVNGVATVSFTPPNSGTYLLVASYNGGSGFSSSNAQTTLVVSPATVPILTWNPNPATIPYGTVLSSAQLNAFEASSIPGVISYSSPLGTVLPVGANVITATFTPTDTVRYTTVTKTATITVTQFTPLITWLTPAAIANGTPLSATQLNAIARDVNGVAVPGTYSYNPPAGTVLPLGTTQDTVTFTPTDTLNFATATATVPISVVLLPTTTTLAVSPNPIALSQSVTLTATVSPAAAPGIVQFADNSGTIAPSQVTLANGIATVTYTPTAAGTHLITASYLGATSYATSSATPVTLVVGQGAPVITFTPNPASIPYGTPLSAAQLNATSTLPGTFAYSTPLGTILDAGVYTLTATFTPTDTTSYTTVTKTATVTVTRFTPVITWPSIQINYGLPFTATQLNAVAKDLNGNAVPGTYTYNPALGALPPVGGSTATVNFTPTNTTNFNTASGTTPVTVFRQQVALTLVPSATSITLGQPVTLTATVTASNTGVPTGTVSLFDSAVNPTLITTGPLANGIFSFVYTPQTIGSHTLNATYSGDTNDEIGLIQGANQPVLTVNAVAPTLTWNPTPTTIAVGKPITASQLNAIATDPSTGAAIPGTFVYTPAAGTAPRSVGTQTLSVLFTPNDLTRYSTKTATTSLTIIRGTPVLTWATPAPINQGTPLSAAQLNAVVVPGPNDTGLTLFGGTYTYTPAAGAILPPGIQTLSVTFTPGDAANYNSVTQTVQLTVLNAVTATLLTSSVNPSVFGQPVVLTTTITQAGTLTTPVTGTVTFYEGDTPLAEPIPVTANAAGATAALTLSNLATGTHQLTAIYSGDANYLTGTTLPLTQTVTMAPVTLNWTPTVATIPYGTALSAAQLNAAPVSLYVSNVTGLLTYTPPAGTILQAGSQTLTATFTPTDTKNFLPAAGSTVINVTQLTPTIAWAAPASIMQGTPLSTTQLNATATGLNGISLPGTFTYTPAAGTILATGTATLRVLFTPADLTNYTTATASVPLTVTSADTTTTLTLSTNSIALGQPVTLAARVAPVAGTGTPTGQVQFTDNSGTITPATATLTNGVASVVYTPTTAGTHLLTAAYLGGTTYNASSTLTPVPLAVGQSTPSLTWTPAPLILGTALGAAQLNAIATDVNGATLPGIYVYTPAAGAILPVGTQPLSVTFTPTDRANYTTATLATTVLVRAHSTATALSSSANPAPFAAPINLIATITPVGGSSTTPITGSVTFLEGTNQLGTAQVANNTATLPIATLGVGNHLLTAVYSGDTPGNYLTSTSATLTQVINTTTPALTWTPNPATIVYGTRLTTAQLNAVARDVTGATLPGTFTYTPAAGAILPAGTQTLTVSFTPTDTVRYTTTTATAALTVTRATPTIVWNTPAPINQGTALSTTQLNATATGIDGLALPGAFTYSPAAGSILSAGTQTLTATFTPTDAANYLTNTASVVLTVLNPTTATILTSSVNPSQFGQPTVLTATITIPVRGSTAPSGNVTFFDGDTQIGDPAPITVTSTGATATLTVATLGVGTHQLTAVYANDPNYIASTSLPLTQTITIAPVTLAWTPTVATIPYGTPLSAAQLNAVPVSPFVPNVSGLLTYTPAAGTILSAGTQTLNATFTPTDTADFLSAAGSTIITVTQATPTITWPAPSAIAQGTALSATQLNAVASGINGQNLPGTYTYTPAAGTIFQAGVTTLRVLFTPADTANYTTATATVPLTVSIPGTTSTIVSSLNPSQSGQAVIFTATVAQTGTSTQPLTGTVTFYDGNTALATAPLTSGSATYATAALSVATHKIRFIYNGTTDYATSISNTINQVVGAATTRIAWTPNPAAIVYGTPLSVAQLNAIASSGTSTTVPGTFTYTPAAGAILTAGTQTLNVTFTPTDTVNFTAATATATITVTRAIPTIAWTAPSAITQGTALSATQLNATATGISPNTTLPGVFTYTPAAGTVLPSGPATLSVLFTPTDIANYATATTTVPLTVSIPAANITLTSTTNPSQYGQPTTLTATVTPGGTLTAIPTGNVTFSDGTRLLGTAPLSAGAATLPTSTLTAGPHAITATYAGDTANATVTSAPLAQTVNKAPAVLTFTPNPATLTYGAALTAAQLNATATSAYVPTVPGTFIYTPALGTVLNAGQSTLSVTFTPTDTANFSATTQTAALTVSKATPTVTFPTPASVPVGTILSSTQLAATATGVTGTTLPGVFTYTPAAGTTITSGPQTLTVLFTPTDTANYTTATATTTLNGTAVTLTALSSTTASLGDPAKTITLTGTGFVSNSVARSNGVGLATTYVNPTTLTAVLPTNSFRTVQTLQITVNNPTQSQTTSALPFTVSAPTVVIKVNAPATANPGDQPSITSALAAAYPVDVTGTFNLTFTPISGGVVDPAIQFSTGGTTSAFTIPAGQTTNPNLQIQTGTVAGTITVRLTLAAGGVDVTPAGLAPLVINVPTIAPTITSVTLTRSGRQLTVRTLGFSNTREVTKATFHFVPTTGQQIQTQDVTVDVGAIFAGWYSQTASTAYGSTFLYTQTFTLDDDATVVGQVTVTLGNSVGASASGSSQ